MKEIVILHKTCVADYPPLLAFIKDLSQKGFIIHLVLGFEKSELLENELKELCKTVHVTNIKPSRNKILYWLKIRRTFWKIIYENGYNSKLIWLPAADTTLALGKTLFKCNYVLNLYELFDYEPIYLKKLKKYAINAKMIICSNMERANILRVWWKLAKTPEVILNKPYAQISGRELELPDDIKKSIDRLSGTKIIIYQGIISKERGLESLCKVLNKSQSKFSLIIMGKATEYLQYLKDINPNILHIPFVSPPYHLHITSHAHIGVLSYDHSSLNNIFCAPNKLWEFSNFELPMLGNDIPGLYNTIELNRMGKCADFNDQDSVENALNNILNNYTDYSQESKKYYNSYNYSYEIDNILNKIKF